MRSIHKLICLAATFLIQPAAEAQHLLGEWPITGHDPQHTAQAELPCNMVQQPKEIGFYDPGRTPLGEVICADVDDDGAVEILYGGSPLVCRTLEGKVKWKSPCGFPLAMADIDGDGLVELLYSCWDGKIRVFQ